MNKKNYKYGDNHELLKVVFETPIDVRPLGNQVPIVRYPKYQVWNIYQQTEDGKIFHHQGKVEDRTLTVYEEGTPEWERIMRSMWLG